MRIYLSLLFIPIFASLHAQTMVCYNYDAAGNRIQKGSSVCAGFTGEDPEKGKNDKETIEERSSNANPTDSKVLIEGKIVPNPTNGDFELRLESVPQEDSWFELYDARGHFLFRQKVESMYTSFDLSSMAAGEYFLYLRAVPPQNGYWIILKQ
jgi:hypothetical protein